MTSSTRCSPRARSGPGPGSSGWGGATRKACCQPSRGDSLAPSTQAAAALGTRPPPPPRPEGRKGRGNARVCPAQGARGPSASGAGRKPRRTRGVAHPEAPGKSGGPRRPPGPGRTHGSEGGTTKAQPTEARGPKNGPGLGACARERACARRSALGGGGAAVGRQRAGRGQPGAGRPAPGANRENSAGSCF